MAQANVGREAGQLSVCSEFVRAARACGERRPRRSSIFAVVEGQGIQ